MATAAQHQVHDIVQDSADKVLIATLTPAFNAVDDGSWLYLGQFSQGISIEFSGLGAGDTVQVYGFNGVDRPDDDVDHTQIGNDQTGTAGNDIVSVGSAPLWIKTKISARAVGTAIKTALVARKP